MMICSDQQRDKLLDLTSKTYIISFVSSSTNGWCFQSLSTFQSCTSLFKFGQIKFHDNDIFWNV